MNTVKVTLQPWLLQHFTGTTGFRVELLLANMVAEKYKSMYEVNFFLDFHLSRYFLYVHCTGGLGRGGHVGQGVLRTHVLQLESHLHESPCAERQDETKC